MFTKTTKNKTINTKKNLSKTNQHTHTKSTSTSTFLEYICTNTVVVSRLYILIHTNIYCLFYVECNFLYIYFEAKDIEKTRSQYVRVGIPKAIKSKTLHILHVMFGWK